MKQLFKGRDNAADAAKQRLRFVLIHDRAEIPPGMLDLIKDDIIAVISHRIPIDRAHVSVNIDNAGSENRLLVDIPLMADERKKSDVSKRR